MPPDDDDDDDDAMNDQSDWATLSLTLNLQIWQNVVVVIQHVSCRLARSTTNHLMMFLFRAVFGLL